MKPIGVPARSLASTRRELVERLEMRSDEIAGVFLACLRDSVTGSHAISDLDYQRGRQASVTAALTYCLEVLKGDHDLSEPIPSAMIAQWQRAARIDLSIDELWRAYSLAQSQLVDLVMEEAEDFGVEISRRLLQTMGMLVQHFMTSMSQAFAREREHMRRSREQHVLECVHRLLSGLRVDLSELDYDFNAWHLGVIATGPRAEWHLRRWAARLGQGALLATPREGTVWGWLGASSRLDTKALADPLVSTGAPAASLAIGEPSWGVDGWRLTHEQAKAAAQVALRRGARVTRYADCPLLASALQDEALLSFLKELYLLPLQRDRDGGLLLRETLEAYFAADCNAATAASVLGVDRHTVARRLQRVEQLLGRRLHECRATLEVAMALEALDAPVIKKL